MVLTDITNGFEPLLGAANPFKKFAKYHIAS